MRSIKVSYIIILCIAAFISLMEVSCKKQKRTLDVGGKLEFSDDTLSFDTVFTAAGSFTSGILIYNPQDQEVVVSSVRLLRGSTSYFHLNVDGFQGNSIPNVKIAPHDSIYVFATVNIDPNDSLTPFIITDSLVATLNGQEFFVPFIAYGQNAHYIKDSALTTDAVWDDVLPYVIIYSNDTAKPRGLQINPGVTLTMKPGTRVYMHQNASVVVLGRLLCNGTKDDSVIFQGDRIDRRYFGYEGYPGEWGSIYFSDYSTGNKLTYTRIENGGNGALGFGSLSAAVFVRPDSVNMNNPAAPTKQLMLDHCIIRNCIANGLLSYQGSVVASNCLFTATGGYALAILKGGYDSLTNCTFANYGGTGLSHTTGTVAILNYYSPSTNVFYYGDLNAVMRNCIVYGTLDSEIVCSAAPDAAAALRMDHCLLNMGSVRESFVSFNACIFNQDPLFNDTQKGDYHLKAGSPAIAAGTAFPGIVTDLKGNTWGSPPDIGCYKY